MIKIAAVSYLNTKPFLYGLEQSDIRPQIDLQLATPARCAQQLLRGEVDLGLVPVAIIPHLSAAHLVTDFCIGANGQVGTVAIFSDCPLAEITHLYLDYQSRTSVELAQYLLKHHWHLQPILLPASEGFEHTIGGKTAGLVIGDRAIALARKHAYSYDLAQYWKAATALPFVFAAWVATRPLPPDQEQALNEAFRFGISRIADVAHLYQPEYPDFSVFDYYNQYIDYQLDAPKKIALSRFLDWCASK